MTTTLRGRSGALPRHRVLHPLAFAGGAVGACLLATSPASALTTPTPSPAPVVAPSPASRSSEPPLQSGVVVVAEPWTYAAPQFTVTAVAQPPVDEADRGRVEASRTSRSVARPTTASPVPSSVAGNAVLEVAAQYVGVPYAWGGSTPDGFDCSGFTSYVYAQLGISLPRTSSGQRDVGTVVSREDALPGDLIWSPGHVAIYAGGDLQIDAPRPGKTIQFRSIWQSDPVFIRVE